MLVLRVFPFRADAGFEQVIVRLEGELGDRCDIVLRLLELDGGEKDGG